MYNCLLSYSIWIDVWATCITITISTRHLFNLINNNSVIIYDRIPRRLNSVIVVVVMLSILSLCSMRWPVLQQRHVHAQLLVTSIAPAAVALAQFRLLYGTGHGQRQRRRIQFARLLCEPDDLLHFRDDLIRFAIDALVVNATISAPTKKQIFCTVPNK